MFVDIVQLPEMPECVISTLVWFECVEAFYRILPRPLYFSPELDRFVLRGTISNGKGNLLGESLSRANGDQAISKMVKSTPEVIEDIACNDGYRGGNVC